ncbi:MAG: hypothetical protein IAE99_07450 [Rhodothermales bacterium]|nr:hypothetical protein [Rhodothermales bacterium]MCA0270014.1 hypothetical protein [Bacteroidota bacterium]
MSTYTMVAIAFAVVGFSDLVIAQLMMARRQARAAKILAAFGAIALGLSAAFLFLANR